MFVVVVLGGRRPDARRAPARSRDGRRARRSGALVIDVLAPVRGRGRHGRDGRRASCLTLVAVAVSGRGQRSRGRRDLGRGRRPLLFSMPPPVPAPVVACRAGAARRARRARRDAAHAPRRGDELDEARELLAYWERRARRAAALGAAAPPRGARDGRALARAGPGGGAGPLRPRAAGHGVAVRDRAPHADDARAPRAPGGAGRRRHRDRGAARRSCSSSPRPWRSSPRPSSARSDAPPRPRGVPRRHQNSASWRDGSGGDGEGLRRRPADAVAALGREPRAPQACRALDRAALALRDA